MSDNTPESGEPAVKRVRKTATRTPKASANAALPDTPAPAAPPPVQVEPAAPSAPPAAPRAADNAPADGGQPPAGDGGDAQSRQFDGGNRNQPQNQNR